MLFQQQKTNISWTRADLYQKVGDGDQFVIDEVQEAYKNCGLLINLIDSPNHNVLRYI